LGRNLGGNVTPALSCLGEGDASTFWSLTPDNVAVDPVQFPKAAAGGPMNAAVAA